MRGMGPLLNMLVKKRLSQGKEDPIRMSERFGAGKSPRPAGPLVWVHGASVGEAQSSLILIRKLTEAHPHLQIMVTTGTVTSAAYMAERLPANAFHQFYPLDHPQWVKRFCDHWQPDFVLWMESELWPCMLQELKNREIPTILVNARLSPRSAQRWSIIPSVAKQLLSTFHTILTQTEEDAQSYLLLGAKNVKVTGNLKYAADLLPYNENDLQTLKSSLGDRPVWLYASTHKGEEELACRLHKVIAHTLPDLLTIIVPRHPERGTEIESLCHQEGLSCTRRSTAKTLPVASINIYIADTLGELGLFYRACPIACIGRSFSDDGGGGHNPIEAAQLGCAVLHGPHIQNLEQIYADMNKSGAALRLVNEDDFSQKLLFLLKNEDERKKLQKAGLAFVAAQSEILQTVTREIIPLLDERLSQQKDAA